MFCHKCGTEIAEGAGFCYKCGTKVVHMGEQAEAVQTVPADTKPPQSVPIQRSPLPTNQPIADDSEFRAFIDSHVRTTTKYQSAQELLSSKVSQKYVLICFAVPLILSGLLFLNSWLSHSMSRDDEITGIIGVICFTAIIGCLAAYITDLVHTSRYMPGFSGSAVIDRTDLILFLNTHLKYLEPHFHEWKEQDERNTAGALASAVVTSVLVGRATGAKWVRAEQDAAPGIYTLFGEKPRWKIKLSLKPDPKRDSQTEYGFVIICLSNIWPNRSGCAAKAPLIVKAALEYYLAHNQKTKEE